MKNSNLTTPPKTLPVVTMTDSAKTDPPEASPDVTECNICLENVAATSMVVFDCSHSTCSNCRERLRKDLCPFCRAPLTAKEDQTTRQLTFDEVIAEEVLIALVAERTRLESYGPHREEYTAYQEEFWRRWYESEEEDEEELPPRIW